MAEPGALDALSSSRPGKPPAEREHELQMARAEVARLVEALKGWR